MSYRSKRFDAGDLDGLKKAWSLIDGLEATGLGVEAEVMAGESYRRQLSKTAREEIGNPNYVLQAILSVPKRNDGMRISARYFIEESRRILGELELPGDQKFDKGGLSGLDPQTSRLPFGSTGRTEDDILYIHAPRVSSRWIDLGRDCMFFCGIEPPKPRHYMEEYGSRWEIHTMRRGGVVFKPTPEGLQTV